MINIYYYHDSDSPCIEMCQKETPTVKKHRYDWTKFKMYTM